MFFFNRCCNCEHRCTECRPVERDCDRDRHENCRCCNKCCGMQNRDNCGGMQKHDNCGCRHQCGKSDNDYGQNGGNNYVCRVECRAQNRQCNCRNNRGYGDYD